MQCSKKLFRLALVVLIAAWNVACSGRDQETTKLQEQDPSGTPPTQTTGDAQVELCPPWKPERDATVGNEPVMISLSRDEQGVVRTNGKAALYAETFVFDKEKGIAQAAAGTEINIVGGYPVPIRLMSMGADFSGTISAVYQNVIFECGKLEPDSQIFTLAAALVQKNFRYNMKIDPGSQNEVFISSAYHVFSGRTVSPQADAPFVQLQITTTEKDKGSKEETPIADVVLDLERPDRGTITAVTDAEGMAHVSLSCAHEDLLWIQATHPKGELILRHPLPISLRGATDGLVIYEIPIRFENTKEGTNNAS